MQVYVGSGSDIGSVRKSNQDAVGVDLQSGFFVVADGTGGQAGGEVACSIIVSVTREMVAAAKPTYEERKAALVEAIREANAQIYQRAVAENKLGMSSTCTAFLIGFGQYFVAHVGDSRAYLIRGTDIIQITKDHSQVQQLVDRGIITQEEARHHENKNVVMRTVGIAPDVEIDTFEGEFRETDILLACSDGLWGMVTDQEIAETVLNSEDSQQACNALIELANKNGGHDNISVVIAQSCPTMRRPLPRKLKSRPRPGAKSIRVNRRVLAGVGGGAALVLLAVLVLPRLLRNPPAATAWGRFQVVPDKLQAFRVGGRDTFTVVSTDSYELRLRDKIVLSKPGYHPETIAVSDLAQKEYPVELEPILVQVTCVLGAGEQVRFADDRGRKLGSVESLPYGSHRLLCRRSGYSDTENVLLIDSPDPVSFVPVFSKSKVGSFGQDTAKQVVKGTEDVTVRFKKDGRITGAEILINGVARGTVPFKFVLKRGEQYKVVLRCKDGTVSRPRDLWELKKKTNTGDFTYGASDFEF